MSYNNSQPNNNNMFQSSSIWSFDICCNSKNYKFAPVSKIWLWRILACRNILANTYLAINNYLSINEGEIIDQVIILTEVTAFTCL